MANHSGIIDSGTYFEIVPNTRKIMVPQAYKVIGTVGEHLAEQTTFRCPKFIDGHDIKNCAKKYITWKNVNGDVGHDELCFEVEDEDYLYFTWSIRDGLTMAFGLVSFSIHFEDTDAEDTIVYRWSTTICSECEVLDAINARLGTYETVYVAEDTLVFSDYNAVKEGVLAIDTNAVIPEGTLTINDNGIHDVGEYAAVNVDVNADAPTGTKEITQNGTYDVVNYAEVNVNVKLTTDTPQITVSEDGRIKATANGAEAIVQLNSDHDPDFIAKNIKEGVTIFGVEGSLATSQVSTVETVSGRFVNDTTASTMIHYTECNEEGVFVTFKQLSGGEDYEFSCVKATIISVYAQPSGSESEKRILDKQTSSKIGYMHSSEEQPFHCVFPVGDDFIIHMVKGQG